MATRPTARRIAHPVARRTAAVPPPPRAAAGATERIVRSIADAIVERRLMPGTKLSEQKLADIYQVSRTLVRQALNRLSRDRLVTLERARGAFVARPGIDEARQVFQVRGMLEGALVRRLCASITPRQIAELRTHLRGEAAAVKRTDAIGCGRLLAEFHAMLARMLGNEVLAQLLAELLSRSSLIALTYPSSHPPETALAEHVQIVDALEQRNPRLAARLMEHHIAAVGQYLQLHPHADDLSAALLPPG